MFAVVDIAGQQFKVTENGKYYVPRLDAAQDAETTFDKVLLIADENKTTIGSPYVNEIKVHARILEHVKDDKVFVFKKKRRTGYKKFRGHCQQLTRIEVTKIG